MRLILTTSDSGAGGPRQTGLADIVIPFGFRFVWGPLPSDADLVTSLSRGSPQPDGTVDLWLRNAYRKHPGEFAGNEIGLIDLCERCETIELWIDPDPNSQLTLIWLLDYLRQHAKIAPKLTLVQADVAIGNHLPDEVATWRLPAITIRNDHLEAASMAWQAYRRPTPQDWFNLLGGDLSVLPQLRHSVLELLEELPMPATGLGATEMRMLELISAGKAGPFDVFPGDKKRNERRVFGYWEVGALMGGLAHCPVPAVSGLDEGPFTPEMHEDRNRHERYQQSKLELTAFGKGILARTEDFSRCNPIHRWWGGTELTNDRLWRWDPATRTLIAP
ncbi:hypothetical protein [Bradyrhizobium erythrophlei]|nr:hypothetical protein [Bradyrhizobium erythrophlei]